MPRKNEGTEGGGVAATSPAISGGVVMEEHVSGQVVAPGLTSPAGGAGGAIGFTDHGGVILDHVHVQLVFWGAAWGQGASPSMGDVTSAVAKILAGTYMSALSQYRNIQRGTLLGSTAVTTSNPPNPFSDSDVSNLVESLLQQGRFPGPATDSQILPIVVMPQGVSSQNAAFIGEHTYYTSSSNQGLRCHFAWVTNSGTLNSITSILSHELVESCTDPEGTAILGNPGTCSQGGWCEIGDVCYTTGISNGVTVQAYWSQRDGACIIPPPKLIKELKPEIKELKDSHKELVKEHLKERIKDNIKQEIDVYNKSLVADITNKPKDLKDAAEGGPPVIDQGDPMEVMRMMAQRIDDLEHRLTLQQPFIRGEERPAVGDAAIEQEDDNEK